MLGEWSTERSHRQTRMPTAFYCRQRRPTGAVVLERASGIDGPSCLSLQLSHSIAKMANLYIPALFFTYTELVGLGLMAKVLIVEDAPFIREMIRDILESHDHEIVGEAANGLEAIEKYKALKPDVVLMDILMPGMDGLSAIMKIMEQDPKAKIIVVSALVKEALRKEAMRAGAVDFVAKPFQVERLLEAVKSATTVAA